MKKILPVIVLLLLVLILIGYVMYQRAFAPTSSTIPVRTVEIVDEAPQELRVVAEALSIPWDVAELPSGQLLVTERTGDLLLVDMTEGVVNRLTVPSIATGGEGGLLGITLHPNFIENRFLFLYRTMGQGNRRNNEVVRFTYTDEHKLTDETVILANIPGALYHDGGALSFGPDGYLYVTTGDAGVPALAQDRSSLAGKILRLTDTGEPAPNNPFGDLVYSYGHRNPQGLAWDSSDQLWSTEHGRSGAQSGYDELNRIEAGGNYGWPDSEGDTVLPGTIGPVLHSGANETWAPASLASVGDTLFFAGLRGQRLYQVSVADSLNPAIEALFPNEYGRLRAARIFGDTLYITTSNTDGRGSENPSDDRLIAIPLSLLE
jgi:glucose/arabinose dehydrogenase